MLLIGSCLQQSVGPGTVLRREDLWSRVRSQQNQNVELPLLRGGGKLRAAFGIQERRRAGETAVAGDPHSCEARLGAAAQALGFLPPPLSWPLIC